MNEDTFRAKGFVKGADGEWRKPARVRAVQPADPQPSVAQPLAGKPKKLKTGKGSVEVIVSLIDCRPASLDSDNSVLALKGIRDAIAESIGYDDGDERVRWEYGILETQGQRGVIVRIEKI